MSSFRDRLKDGSEGPELVWLPTGTFLMGSPAGDKMAFDDERPQHEVRIARPFAIGRVPVTFADYDRFCTVAGRARPGDQGWGRGRRPVIKVSWADAVAYCVWLTEQTGRTYRLPSEAEWEYACRAGTQTRWSFGDDEQALGDHAWFNGNSGGQTHPVGEKRPNPWGLHDLHGNVWEWVQDHWHNNYQGATPDGRSWEDASGEWRVQRGGSWISFGRYLRCAYRHHYGPGGRFLFAGFRLVLGPQPKQGQADG
ncbi:formylglycine-generating enzyme family protein [uncultured Thiodictyon sp.]|uniref:formylglycine-generating enzyme family protein n=1 Tax=uncultured Thiodictyon sp. TaxID=1846217 RepID=UPI0025D91928|nr:formylglycine-generating enzyme family protein [uncultured Thiodictyon sp.]